MNKGNIEVNELLDIHNLTVNMYKEGYLDGYLLALDSTARKKGTFDKKATWEAIKDHAYKDFQKFIKFKNKKNSPSDKSKKLKGGKKKS